MSLIGKLINPKRVWILLTLLAVFGGAALILLEMKNATSDALTIGLFLGGLIALALTHFFHFITTGNSVFALFTASLCSVCLLMVNLFDYGAFYFWAENKSLHAFSVSFFANGSIIFSLLLANNILGLHLLKPILSQLVKGSSLIFIVNIVMSFFVTHQSLQILFFSLLIIVYTLLLYIGFWLSFKGESLAKYFTLGWLVIWVTLLAIGLHHVNVITLSMKPNDLLIAGLTCASLLFSMLMAKYEGDKYIELEASQALAIHREKEMAIAQQQLLDVEQSAKDELEYKVQERTLELEITLRELSDANEELARLNTIDALTGIKNRRHFDKRLMAEGRRSRREQTTLCLVMLDIDHFKRVNDEKGHDVGDLCIQHIASLAKSHIKRPSDDLCRYGGEEFAFILPNTTEQGAEPLIDSIRQAIQTTPCRTENEDVFVTISAGIASAVVTYEQGEKKILKAADEALYQAKQDGRNRVVVAHYSEK